MNPPNKPDTSPMDATAPASGPVQGSGSGLSQGSFHPRPDQSHAAPTLSVGGPGLDIAAHPPSISTSRPTNRSTSRSSTGFDPGWFFVIAGVLLLGATVLIPAADDLDEAQFLRDRARLIQQHRQSRIDRYREYLNALSSKDRQLVVALAASQLNEIPADRKVMDAWPDARIADASVFPALEPPPLALPQRQHVESTLMRWTMEEKSRLWVIAGGAGLVLFGLLPKTSKRG